MLRTGSEEYSRGIAYSIFVPDSRLQTPRAGFTTRGSEQNQWTWVAEL